jgi:tRNA (cmo5U34)-methyltransferase
LISCTKRRLGRLGRIALTPTPGCPRLGTSSVKGMALSRPEERLRSRVAEPASSLGHRPEGRWAFAEEVSRVFDDMLRRSIPQYETMRRLVFEIGRRFVRPGSAIVDLGCSRGEALAPFIEAFGRGARYVGVEVSAPMLEACRRRFAREIESGTLSLVDLDLRCSYPNAPASVTLSVLTLQFTPIEHRPRIVQDVYDHTIDGGAFLLVEKVLASSARTDRVLTDLYHELKRTNGYAQEEIERKRLSLEGVLVPVAAGWNEDLLRHAGFREVECVWRWLNFAAWLAIKGA